MRKRHIPYAWQHPWKIHVLDFIVVTTFEVEFINNPHDRTKRNLVRKVAWFAILAGTKHREAFQKIAMRPDSVPSGVADDEALRVQVIEAAHRSKRMQRKGTNQANLLVLDQLFGDDLAMAEEARPRRSGVIMGISSGKVHVQIEEPAIDVKV